MTQPVELEAGLLVTRGVERRISKEAQTQVSEPWALWSLRRAGWVVGWSVIPLMIVLGNIATDQYDSGQWPGWVAWLVFLSGSFGLPFVVYMIIMMLMSPHEVRYEAEVRDTVADLARRRRERIDERDEFYHSSEWLALRQQVILEDGRDCAWCGRAIDDDVDLTIDHIRPRSKYPELSLVRENLQVLCRPCNASKGARETLT